MEKTALQLAQEAGEEFIARRRGKRWPIPAPDEIRNLRQGLKLSQSQFAAQFGLDVRALQDWESARERSPDQSTCLLLALIKLDPEGMARSIGQLRSGRSEVLAPVPKDLATA